MNSVRCVANIVAALLFLISPALAGDDGNWSVSKLTGEVWLSSADIQQASLTAEKVLNPGDTIHTGSNGRVLLVRGEETIWISPNSMIGIPKEKKDGLATTILQQAGSILLDVEKRNVKHFEVETPYLAAVVKGTQFSVTVGAKSTNVSVRRGEVEVSDFKTGQIAHVMPGQGAAIVLGGKPGLVLSGSGTFQPIEHGKPRSPGIEPIRVPKGGLTAPGGLSAPLHAQTGGATRQTSSGGSIAPVGHNVSLSTTTKPGVVRINSAIGEVKLNFHSVTKGLAHGVAAPTGAGRSASTRQDNTSIWSGGQSSSSMPSSASPSQPAGPGGTGNGGAGGMSAAVAPPPSVVGPGGAGGDGPPGKGPGGDGPPGKGPGGGNGATGAGGHGPPGHGPDGNGPPGHGQGGPPGKGK
jgi:FecR protein